jgi:hypothetical protein
MVIAFRGEWVIGYAENPQGENDIRVKEPFASVK